MQTPIESNYDGSSKKHKKTFSTNIKKTDFCGIFSHKKWCKCQGLDSYVLKLMAYCSFEYGIKWHWIQNNKFNFLVNFGLVN